MVVVRITSSQTDTSAASGAMSTAADTARHSTTARQTNVTDACALNFLTDSSLLDSLAGARPFLVHFPHRSDGLRFTTDFGVRRDLSAKESKREYDCTTGH